MDNRHIHCTDERVNEEIRMVLVILGIELPVV